MPSRFEYSRLVTFAETDMAGIMHFGNFFRLMEECEHAFYRSLGFSVHPSAEPRVGWPRVHASCDFRQPLRFEDAVAVELLVEEVRSKTIRYLFRFWKKPNAGHSDRTLCATGRFTVVCIGWDPESGAMKARHIPDNMRAAIQPADASALAEPPNA